MTESHVLSGLVKKRAELSSRIEQTHLELSTMIRSLEKLDDVINLFDPEYKPEGIKPAAFRPPQDWAKRGEMQRTILSILRQASEPLVTGDIALQMLKERAIDTDNPKLMTLMRKRCGVALRGLRSKGIVQSEAGPGQWNLWWLVR